MGTQRVLRVVGAVLIFGCWATVLSSGQSVTTLVALSSKQGVSPIRNLVQATDGNFYGTTEYGGAYGSGAVIRVSPGGTVKTLYSFCKQPNCTDGQTPGGSLLQASDGNFYGTTSQGGTANTGTVFKITKSGKLTSLYSFCSQSACSDGNYPGAGLIQATDGNLYGETANGGAYGGGCGSYGCGTLFEITTAGVLTTIYTFCVQPNDNCTDGELPMGGLLEASDGNLYGTTASDGNSDTCSNGCGTIFKLSPARLLTTLYTFCSKQNCADGTSPESGVIEGNDGNFYGTTNAGGMQYCGPYGFGCGTVFQLSPAGKLTALHSFDNTDGAQVFAGVVQGTDGNFYGTTYSGGANDNCFGTCGTLFSMTPTGSLTSLYDFCAQSNCPDGDNPVAGLIQGTNGQLYGMASAGGTDSFTCTFGCGTIFSLNMGLGPFVTPRPNAGPVKSKVVILGTDLTGTTNVSFNGVAAKFKVVSATEITTKVPKGATTGTLTVTTPGGTLKSNVAFRVTN
ncbi:MAG TPA: choice-of-anchor tandem repeat GloVer-containing protein [Terriglobales bacterium]|nr:choice-of-anchor tandem repeat GloVer-containing protein [Terriglobales bacterium]